MQIRHKEKKKKNAQSEVTWNNQTDSMQKSLNYYCLCQMTKSKGILKVM